MPCKIQITKEITSLVEKQTEPFMGLSLKSANKEVEKVNKLFRAKVAKFVMFGDIMDRIITIPESLVQIYYNNELKIEEREASKFLKEEEEEKERKYIESKKEEWKENKEYFENDEPFTRNSSSTKPNATQGQQGSLFGLDNNNLEFHINTLGVVTNFLENIGIEPRLVSEFLSQEGTVVESAIAAANFIEGTVDIIDDLEKRPSAWNKLPEEAAHFWYRLLDTNSQLKDALLTSALTDRKEADLRNSLYGDTYKEGVKVIGKLALDSNSNITSKPALSPIREEAIGQLIAEAIKRIETKNASASDYSFFKKFLEWINSVLDTFKNTTQDPFEVAAMKILSSDMSDLMTWEEYRKLNNIVNFADVLTEQSIAPIDYTLIEDIGFIGSTFMEDENGYATSGYKFHFKDSDFMQKYGENSPSFFTQQELDNWVSANIKEYNQRQKAIIQEVKDNQIFFDRLLNKSFRKKSKFLSKTLRKYFQIIDVQNLDPLREWNISQELQQITKKLTEEEKKQIVETNGYTNIAPTLKVLPDLLQKYKKNPIVLSEPIKIDGAKKQELSILNGIKEMIKLENPNLKSITAEEFVAEAHNWLKTNYLLGFANEKNYLTYHVDQTFTHVKDRFSNEASPLATMTEEEINQLPLTERQRIANIVGLTKQNPDVYHNKVSIRFNDMSHLKSGHFNLLNGGSPSAWGNLTYFYSGKNKWKDVVLLHEIQNDNIEFLRDFKAEKVDLETSLGRYLQQLNTDLLYNITQIESGGKRIQKNYLTEKPRQHTQLNYQLQNLVSIPLEQGLDQLKQNLNENIQLYKSDNSIRTNPEKAQEKIEKTYSQKRKFADFQRRGGIKSLLTKEELENLKEILKELNTGTIMTDAEFLPDENQYEPGYETIRDLRRKKEDFQKYSDILVKKINFKVKELYGKDFPYISLSSPVKPRTKSQKRAGAPINQSLNENVNSLLAINEININKNLSKNIEFAKKDYVRARNAFVGNNFNEKLVKITQEQYNYLIENYKYNQDLLNKLIDEQAQKDIQKESVDISSLTDKEIQEKIEYTTDFDNIIGEEEDIEKAILKVRNAYNKEEQINLQNSEYENLKKLALEKKEELDKNYGKIENEVKQTLEIEMNYFTPLVHHLIQKHINQYGKDFPMYFSGYNITKLTQGNERTAMIYAGKDEINIVDKNGFKFNEVGYTTNENYKGIEGFDDSKNQYFKEEEEISQQEYEKAYQQATERKAKEIKVKALNQMNLFNAPEGFTSFENLTNEQLDVAIKTLNEYKKQSKQNLDRVVNTIMNISNNKPIETGAIYNAMTQISGVKLIWQDAVPGLRPSVTPQISTATGGYLVDLSNYNYNVPILYGLDLNKKKSNIKPGVEELFDSNPELANAVYSKILTDSGLSAENWEDSDNECGI